MSMTTKFKNVLIYTGTIGAIISAIAYIVVTVVLILGFEQSMELEKQILFSIIGAVDGVLITLMLRNQGIALAKNEDESKRIMKAYYEQLNKTKKAKQLHTITYHYTIALIFDIIIKGLFVALTTYMILYIYMDGNGDFALLGLAFANIIMFVCFGIIALSKFYDLYKDEHLPVIIELTNKLKLDQVGSVQPKEKENGIIPNITTASQKE